MTQYRASHHAVDLCGEGWFSPFCIIPVFVWNDGRTVNMLATASRIQQQNSYPHRIVDRSQSMHDLSAESAANAWAKCLDIIKDSVTYQAYKTWFEPVKPIKLNNSQ